MAVPGNWTLFYDWGCDGGYSRLNMSVNADGSWTAPGFTGTWVQVAGMFMFTFNNSDTTYAGNLANQSITGISTTFGGLNGCFYMLQEGVPTSFVAERIDRKADMAGNM